MTGALRLTRSCAWCYAAKAAQNNQDMARSSACRKAASIAVPESIRRRAMKTSLTLKGLLIAGFVVLGAVSMAAAADKTFYEGKTVTVLINYAAGGPTDVEGRIIAKHLGKHIPGKPSVVVQNMGGGGGVTATNYLGEVAKPDGLTVGYFTGALFRLQLKEGTRVDASKYPFIGAVESVAVSYIRSDVPPGIKRPEDIVKAQRFKAGGLSNGSSKDVRFRLSFDLLGLPYDYVTGYSSSSTARLAVQRNEVQYHDETLPGYRTQVESQMVKTGMVTPLWYTDLVTPDGDVKPSADVPELLPFTQFYRKVMGKSPSGVKYEALKAANMSSTNMQRTILLSPGSPEAAAAAMRQAVEALSRDEEFLAEAKKVMRFQPRFQLGEEGIKLYKQVSDISPEIVTFLKDYIAEQKK
jgi:tripartite-type tricarboxylate transporter receptor subunit TctC